MKMREIEIEELPLVGMKGIEIVPMPPGRDGVMIRDTITGTVIYLTQRSYGAGLAIFAQLPEPKIDPAPSHATAETSL